VGLSLYLLRGFADALRFQRGLFYPLGGNLVIVSAIAI
jgi:hypothetical protein